MQLLSKELVSEQYCSQLQQDLGRATVCRFLVAYISRDGLKSIGRQALVRVLRHRDSFGIGSLSCSCRFDALLDLQDALPGLRLKYFMDPKVSERNDEPDDLVLFHSKLVYLLMEREQKAVIYIGSHNWTRRALGPQGPRNAEASLRIEVNYVAGDLDGSGNTLASEVNRHLLGAWSLPLCVPALSANRNTFDEWYAKGCRRPSTTPLEQVTIILAVRKSNGSPPLASDWLKLERTGIYFQGLEEAEGQLLWNSRQAVFVLVWESEQALKSAQQPLLLECRITTFNACPNSQLRATNKSNTPVVGFQTVIFDEVRLNTLQRGPWRERPAVKIWSGTNVNIYDFEFPTLMNDSSQVDGSAQPKYRFYLDIDKVVFPADRPSPVRPTFVWDRESFAVAASKNDAKYEEKPGYYVEPDTKAKMLHALVELLKVPLERAKVLPFSDRDDHKAGKRVSKHPLHDTFIGHEQQLDPENFYSKVPLGNLVADIDRIRVHSPTHGDPAQGDLVMPRVQRVFTMPIQELERNWRSFAAQWHPPTTSES